MSLKLIFMGTPEFAVPALAAVHAAGHKIVAVYTQPPRQAGRGMALRKSAVHQKAEALNLPVLTPENFKAETDREGFRSLKADAAIVVAYGLILPEPILEGVLHGCFNIHPSLLPRWRGAAPLQRAIMAGDEETGVAVMRMEAGLDTGPVCRLAKMPLTDDITASQLHDTLAERGAALMVETLAALKAGSLICKPQAEAGVTYAAKISKAEAHIDFTQNARRVLRHIHGLSPFPGAWCMMQGHRVKILKAEWVKASGKPGAVLDAELTIACGEDALRPIILQREGKQATSREEFLRGLPLPAATELG